jgi:hypothetical protein
MLLVRLVVITSYILDGRSISDIRVHRKLINLLVIDWYNLCGFHFIVRTVYLAPAPCARNLNAAGLINYRSAMHACIYHGKQCLICVINLSYNSLDHEPFMAYVLVDSVASKC